MTKGMLNWASIREEKPSSGQCIRYCVGGLTTISWISSGLMPCFLVIRSTSSTGVCTHMLAGQCLMRISIIMNLSMSRFSQERSTAVVSCSQ